MPSVDDHELFALFLKSANQSSFNIPNLEVNSNLIKCLLLHRWGGDIFPNGNLYLTWHVKITVLLLKHFLNWRREHIANFDSSASNWSQCEFCILLYIFYFSYKTKMTNKLRYFKIQMDDESLLYFPGTFLTGKVILELDEDIPILGKWLSLIFLLIRLFFYLQVSSFTLLEKVLYA